MDFFNSIISSRFFGDLLIAIIAVVFGVHYKNFIDKKREMKLKINFSEKNIIKHIVEVRETIHERSLKTDNKQDQDVLESIVTIHPFLPVIMLLLFVYIFKIYLVYITIILLIIVTISFVFVLFVFDYNRKYGIEIKGFWKKYFLIAPLLMFSGFMITLSLISPWVPASSFAKDQPLLFEGFSFFSFQMIGVLFLLAGIFFTVNTAIFNLTVSMRIIEKKPGRLSRYFSEKTMIFRNSKTSVYFSVLFFILSFLLTNGVIQKLFT